VNTFEQNHTPRVPQRPRLRNDARTLLRSRPVQLVLVAGTLLQVLIISERRRSHGDSAAPAMEAVRVLPPQRLGEIALEPAPKKKPEVKEIDRAQRLAEKYRDRGYRVSDRLAAQIHEAAVDNGIDPALAFGLVRTESGFRNSATSHVGATGLTQLMPATARWIEPGTTRSDLRDSETNLRIGFSYLRRLIRKYDGDTTLALLAYNRGPAPSIGSCGAAATRTTATRTWCGDFGPGTAERDAPRKRGASRLDAPRFVSVRRSDYLSESRRFFSM
jgi:soluble lytic murein transglycosylase-like protein